MDTLKAFDDFKSKRKVYKVMFFDKRNGTKNALFFLARAPTHHSLTFNLRLLYELKREVDLSKTVCGMFHFQFRFALLNFTFLFKKVHGLLGFKTSQLFSQFFYQTSEF